MFEPKNVAVDETSIERLLYQKLQIAHAQHRNGALPADPDIALRLWLHLHDGVAEESACHCPIEFSPHSDHGEGLARTRPDEFFGVRVQDDAVERLRVAVEYRRHDAMARRGDSVAKDRIHVTARKSQQTRQRPISGLLPPFPEQMKDEEQRCRHYPCRRFQRKEGFDLLYEERQHLDTLVSCSL